VGYNGSGPAELARAVLIEAYPGDAIVRESRCYLAFKREVIATIRTDVWILAADEIAAWRERLGDARVSGDSSDPVTR